MANQGRYAATIDASFDDSAVSNSTDILEQYFTKDQSQTLQKLFLAHQSYLFRCLYEMETHLEISSDELKKRQAKTEVQVEKLMFLTESTRYNILSLAKRVDGLDVHQRKKRKRSDGSDAFFTLKDRRVVHTPGTVDDNSSSPVCSDSSTLLGGSPNGASRRPSGSFSGLIHSNQVNFSSAPTVPGGFSPAKWTVALPSSCLDNDNDKNLDTAMQEELEPVSGVRSSSAPPPSSPESLEPLNPEPEPKNPQEARDQPDPERVPSHPQFPTSEPDFIMDFATTEHTEPEHAFSRIPSLEDNKLQPPNPSDDSEDEEIVTMQLTANSSAKSSGRPSPALILDVPECGKEPDDTPNISSTPKPRLQSLRISRPLSLPPRPSSLQSSLPPSHLDPRLESPNTPRTPPRSLRSSSNYDLTNQSHQTPIPGAREMAEAEATSQFLETPESLDSKGVQHYFFDELIRSLSPLSDLTEISSAQPGFDNSASPPAEGSGGKNDSSDVSLGTFLGPRIHKYGAHEIVKEESEELETFVDIPLSEALTKSVLMKSEQQRAALQVKKAIAVKKRLQKPKRVVKAVSKMDEINKTLSKKKAMEIAAQASGREKGCKRRRPRKIKWPEMYDGDKEDEFYRKLIECDLCACWYHYGCAGITPEDVRLNNSEIYVCPVCATFGENKQQAQLTCSRPGCGRSEPDEFFVSGIAGRKIRYDENGKVKFLYLVKWDGYPLQDATWERKSAIQDPKRLIEEFEEACKAEGLSLETTEPILLAEAVVAGWQHILEFTDPSAMQVPLEGLPQHQHLEKNGIRVLVPVPVPAAP